MGEFQLKIQEVDLEPKAKIQTEPEVKISFKTLLKEADEEIRKLYLADDRPWVIGYSGGKDSTTVCQLVVESLSKLQKDKLKKKIYIISSDTMIEIPLVLQYLDENLNRMRGYFEKSELPIEVHKVKPRVEDTFWVSMIGKGYPSPRQKFRWCTDKLKINPSNLFITDRISEKGEAIIVLGVRNTESSSRKKSMEDRKINGSILRTHSTLVNAYVYAPIELFTADDVWEYLLTYDSPWGSDNGELLALYRGSTGECPLVVDRNTPSCGNSRFGCWICTVVNDDKALKGFIENGKERWLMPLFIFRNWIKLIRDDRSRRSLKGRRGVIRYLPNGQISPGPFTLECRREILIRLLQTQIDLNKQKPYGEYIELVTKEELMLIREHWITDGDYEDTLPTLYREVMGEPLFDDMNQPIFSREEMNMLKELCEEEGVPFELIWKLTDLELKEFGFKYRHGITDKIHKILTQDWFEEFEEPVEEEDVKEDEDSGLEQTSLFDAVILAQE